MPPTSVNLGVSGVPLEDTYKDFDAPQIQSTTSKAKNCAECRRLKIKCDRKIPCNNCTKRGCPSLCPDGRLVSKGNRLVLANTEDLHGKIEELSSRIRDLESALASSHAKISDESHPLLAPDLLLTGSIRREEEDPNDAPVTSFGSLMIGGDGTAKFFGATSGAEWVIPLEDDDPRNGYACLPVSVAGETNSLDPTGQLEMINAEFLHTSNSQILNIPILKNMIVSELPPREKAISLINLYYSRVAWEFDPVPRKQLIEEFFVPCYSSLKNPTISNHGLALLYAVFGMGMSHNPEQSNYGVLAYKYITLSRACLAIDCVFVNTSITTINALILHINYYSEVSDDPGGAAKAWGALGTALKLAQALGLHREPSMWGLPAEEIIRRRRTMWELVTQDLWQALHFGRPPMISRQHFDVEIPLDEPEASAAEPCFHRGKHHFSLQCLWPVLDLALASANRGSYSAILKLDKKIRDWTLPKHMKITKNFPPSEDQQTAYTFQRTVIFIVREVSLMCLHRAYFAMALLEPPFEPLRSRYSRSVLAAYASACAVLGRIRTLYAREPILIIRFSLFWTNSFTAAVLLGAIAARAPDCPLAATALAEFDYAVEMFTRAQHGYRAARLLPVLLDLKTKAHAAVEAYRSGRWRRPTEADSQLFPGLGGSRAILQHTRPQTTSTPSPSSIGNDSGDILASLDQVKPTLEEYLRSFNPQSTGSANHGPMSVPSSDAFLHGALTGDWGALPSSSAPLPDVPGALWEASASETSHPNLSQHVPSYNASTAPSSSAYSHSPNSDLNAPTGSSRAPPLGAPPVVQFGIQPAAPSFAPNANALPASQDQDVEATILWDSFLRDLGIPPTRMS